MSESLERTRPDALVVSLSVERTLGNNPGDMRESVQIEMSGNLINEKMAHDIVLWLLKYSSGSLDSCSEENDEQEREV